jgi:hypothetical protein
MEAEAARSESAEARLRLAELLKRLKARDGQSPDRLRLIRAVEVVETLGTSGAKALLEVWAGSARATLAGEATTALARRGK